MIISIVTSDNREGHLVTYRDLVSTEWGEDHSFVPPRGAMPLPSPLLALAGDELVGGISFTWHPAPGTADPTLWINTLYVKETYRRRGIALKLIEAAEQTVLADDSSTGLLVYTHLPALYTRRDWVPVSLDNAMWVLSKKL